MSRLDRAGVDRANRDLMYALAFHADKGVGVGIMCGTLAGVEVLPQRKDILRPGTMAQPFAAVDRVHGTYPQQIESRALHAISLRENMGNIGVDRSTCRQGTTYPGEPDTGKQGHVNAEAAIQMSVIRTPQCDELAALFLDLACQRE